MSGAQVTSFRSRMRVEDLLLGALSIATGPLLWWLSQSWSSLSAATSGQTLEYWIALVCGFVGVVLSVVWVIFFLAGLGMVLGLKTRNAALAYWSEIFTPKFLRRLIISILGLQVAVAPQAFALPSQHEGSETNSSEEHQPFMPDIYDPQPGLTESPSPTDELAPTEAPTATPHPSPEASGSIASPATAPASTPAERHSPTGEPRLFSDATISPETSLPPSDDLAPAPRQTSTIEVEPEAVSENQTDRHQQRMPNRFLPQQPVPSPYIAAPQPTRNIEDPTVVVKTGDCLWDIAHHELGAEATLFQIDQRWRQWWEYNRTEIGEDPHVLSPGTVLKAPPFTS